VSSLLFARPFPLSLSLSLSLGPVKRCARKNSYGIMGVTRTVVAIPVTARVAIVINPDVRTALQCHVKSSSIARKKGPELLPRPNEIRRVRATRPTGLHPFPKGHENSFCRESRKRDRGGGRRGGMRKGEDRAP